MWVESGLQAELDWGAMRGVFRPSSPIQDLRSRVQGGQDRDPPHTPHIPCRSLPKSHLELGEAIWQPEWQWMKKPKAASTCFIGCQTLACLASVLAVPFPSSSVASRLLFK